MKQTEIYDLLKEQYDESGKTTLNLRVETDDVRTAMTALRHLKVKGTVEDFNIDADDGNIIIITGFSPDA